MSRLGQKSVEISAKLQTEYKDRVFKVKGPLGELTFKLPPETDLELKKDSVSVLADFDTSYSNMMGGTARSIIFNMVHGVEKGYTKKLNLVGVGYRAQVNGQTLTLNVGYSKPVEHELPKEVKGQVEGNTEIILTSCDKQLLGQTVAKIRSYRKPEPYKGKGILMENEVVRRKAGKAGKSGGK